MQKRKISLIGAPAKEKILEGVDKIANAVKLTLGPGGKNFASGVRGGPIAISNDGVSLAKEIQGDCEFSDIGVRAVREAATKTNDKAGDGTTTAVTLTQAILGTLGFDKNMIGSNASAMVKKIAEESDEVVDRLNKMAKKVETREQLIAVAKVSVEDEKLADMIGGAQWDVGPAGTVMAEEHNVVEDTVEFIYGIRIDNGLGAGNFANNLQKMALELTNVKILVTNKIFNKEQDIRDLTPLFENLIRDGEKGVVLMGRAFDVTSIALCKSNVDNYFAGKGGFPIYPINCPYVDMDEVMADLAAATGGTYVTADRNFSKLTVLDVGKASKVFCTRYEGIITGTKKGEDAHIDGLVEERVKDINEKLTGPRSDFEKKNLEARLAQMTVGTALIKIGAETEQERRYKKDKVDDGVNAVKAAIKEGVVPGAGKAFMAIADEMKDATIADALREPHRQIMANAGGDFDVPEWVQDPLLVVRTAFEKASSIARSLATTEILVTWEWEKPSYGPVQNMAPEDEE